MHLSAFFLFVLTLDYSIAIVQPPDLLRLNNKSIIKNEDILNKPKNYFGSRHDFKARNIQLNPQNSHQLSLPQSGSDYSDASSENLTDDEWLHAQKKNKNPVIPLIPAPEPKYCEPDIFRHTYITGDDNQSITQPITNNWQRARAGERATTRQLCLLPNGLPLTRACVFNVQTGEAEWESITQWQPVSCLLRPRQRIATSTLNEMHEELVQSQQLPSVNRTANRQMLHRLDGILQSPDYKILPADVHYTGKILREISNSPKDPEMSHDVVGVCSQLMSQDPAVLRLSGAINATNYLLETFEQYMDDLTLQVVSSQCGSGGSIFALNVNTTLTATPANTNKTTANSDTNNPDIETVDYPNWGVRAHLSQNISVFFVNPECANITGIAVYDPTTIKNERHQFFSETRGDFLYRFIHWNEQATKLLKEPGLQLATFVPFKLWQSVTPKLILAGRTPMVVLKVYATDCLFVEQVTVTSKKPFSKILSISIPGYTDVFSEVLPFVLRNEHFKNQPNARPINGTGCGYWNYDTWVNDGVQTTQSTGSEPVLLCGSYHLTQFSYLVGGSYRQSDPSGGILINPVHQNALDIISLLGCSLSLLGLLGIWLTAVLFRSWRVLASTKILLNLCFALTFQIILFVFVNTDDISQQLVEEHFYVNCVVLGALMQYSILVLFSWMLIVAYLQFQRYVTVIGITRPKHYILKSAVAAWGFPLIPTLLVAFIDPQSYIPSEYQIENAGGICYPSGHGLHFGVILPISLIVIANLTIFIYVFYSISHTLRQSIQKSEQKLIRKQIRLSVLLFFLFGLSWIFGIFAFMRAGIVFSYLFCITATMQGFVLFVYFVLLDELTRNLWLNLICAGRAKKEAEGKSREMQSMTSSMGMSSSGAQHSIGIPHK